MTKRKANPQKAGRKTKYKPEFDDLGYKYALLSLTDVEMADLFGVPEKTFSNWKKKHPTFRQSINNGKHIADAEVASSLVERAKGYEFEEAVPIKVKEVKYENGKRVREWEKVEVTMVHRVVPPDTRAIQYWLNNRRRKRAEGVDGAAADNSWADRHEVDHTTGGEKMPAPQVYLPSDLPSNIVDDVLPPENATV